MSKKIKLVIFDLDGTLINAYPAICQSFNHVMKQMGFPRRNHADIRRAVGWGERQLLVPFIAPRYIDRALKLYRAHHIKALNNTSPSGKRGVKFSPGAKRLLKRLKNQGYKIAVATNRPRRTSLVILEHLKIKKDFNAVICGDKIKRSKPHPEMLNTILEKLSLKPSESLYVGDMSLDVQAGKRANIKTVAVATGSCTRAEIVKAKPYKTVDNIFKVMKILDQLNSSRAFSITK